MPLEFIYGVGCLVVGGIWLIKTLCFTSPPAPSSSPPSSLPRRMSFTSYILVDGSFPEKVKVNSPIINILLQFKNLPTPEQIAENCKRLLFYDRFRCACLRNSRGEFEFVECDVNILKNHVSTLEVDSEEELLVEVDRINSTDIGGYNDRPLWIFHRIVNTGQGQSGILMRIHHVIG